MKPTIYAIATMDSKGHELAYVRDRIAQTGTRVVTVDVGTLDPPVAEPDIDRTTVASAHPDGSGAVLSRTDRGPAVTAMGEALGAFLVAEHAAGKVSGVIGLGGSGGTALITSAMRALPIGLPKLMVSTVASGDTAPYVGLSDITMMFSVVDVAGINSVSRRILANAAHAVVGMATHDTAVVRDRPVVAMTMFGVTTPCVDAVRRRLESEGFDTLVFHATGTGGRAMEKLIEAGLVDGVLDITTTEVADEVAGGVFPAGSKRFDAIMQAGVPCVMSLGALDMVNFGPPNTVPERFAGRLLHQHNAQVTLMRTTAAENRAFAAWMARKINRSSAPLVLMIPEGGVSLLDAPGRPFHDAQTDEVLFAEIESRLEKSTERRVMRLPYHINDPEFAEALATQFMDLWRACRQGISERIRHG